MKLDRVEQVAIFYEPTSRGKMKVGRLALRQRRLFLVYDAGFLASGLELSPLKLPLAAGVMVGDPTVLEGLKGVFDDSLPDGWGRLLIDRRAAEVGIASRTLTPLDRLALVGSRAMGALVYEPESARKESGPRSSFNLARRARCSSGRPGSSLALLRGW